MSEKLFLQALVYKGRRAGKGWTRDVRWSKKLTGFGLRVFPSGRIRYVVLYRDRKQKKRLLTVGKPETISFGEALMRCKEHLRSIHNQRYLE